jgi:hypothetical protein
MSEVTRRAVVKATALAAGAALAVTTPVLASAAQAAAGDSEPKAEEKLKLRTAVKIWRQATFGNLAALVSFVNAQPAQGAGEVVVASVHTDGKVDALYFM